MILEILLILGIECDFHHMSFADLDFFFLDFGWHASNIKAF